MKKVRAKKRKTAPTLKGIAVSVDRLTSTVDNLAVATAKGFQEVHGRIDELDTRLTGHMDVLEQKINSVHHSVLMLQYDYGRIKTCP